MAMKVYEQHGDLEQVRGLSGHARIETTQLYAQIRPAALKQAVEFYEAKRSTSQAADEERFVFEPGRRRDSNMQPSNINEKQFGGPQGDSNP
jgi:hypothetical protein